MQQIRRWREIMIVAPVLLMLSACYSSHRIKVEPVEIKPIHITIDVNVRVERALDDFFGDLDQESTTIQQTTPEKQTEAHP